MSRFPNFAFKWVNLYRYSVACLKVASQAIAAMPMVLFTPAIPLLMNVVFLGWSALVAVFLYASGTITKSGDTVSISWDETLQYMSLYHLFGRGRTLYKLLNSSLYKFFNLYCTSC
jgi:hypothetical protein